MNEDTLAIYTVKVYINEHYTFRMRTFSHVNAEEVLVYYYHDKLFSQQPDITKYKVTHIANFKDTEQLSIALKGYEYYDKFAS